MLFSKKDLTQLLKTAIKETKKADGLNSKEQFLFKKYGDYFITISVLLSGKKNEKIVAVGSIKPYAFDDIFWQVLHMQDKCSGPMSLRLDGGFNLHGLILFWEYADYSCKEELPATAASLLHKCYMQLVNTIDSLKSVEDFLALAMETENHRLFDHELFYLISLVADKRYDEARSAAKELQSKGQYGRFQKEGKYIYEYIIEYCDENL